jgi:hypothetical protein
VASVESVNIVYAAQDRNDWQVLVNTTVDLSV